MPKGERNNKMIVVTYTDGSVDYFTKEADVHKENGYRFQHGMPTLAKVEYH